MTNWLGTIDWKYDEEERPAMSKGARLTVYYAEDTLPPQTFIVDDVRDNEDGSQTVSVHLDGLDLGGVEFLWYGANDESPAQPSEDD